MTLESHGNRIFSLETTSENHERLFNGQGKRIADLKEAVGNLQERLQAFVVNVDTTPSTEQSPRVRVGIETTSKDIESFSCTIELHVGDATTEAEWDDARSKAIGHARYILANLRAGREGQTP